MDLKNNKQDELIEAVTHEIEMQLVQQLGDCFYFAGPCRKKVEDATNDDLQMWLHHWSGGDTGRSTLWKHMIKMQAKINELTCKLEN